MCLNLLVELRLSCFDLFSCPGSRALPLFVPLKSDLIPRMRNGEFGRRIFSRCHSVLRAFVAGLIVEADEAAVDEAEGDAIGARNVGQRGVGGLLEVVPRDRLLNNEFKEFRILFDNVFHILYTCDLIFSPAVDGFEDCWTEVNRV
jgi:hypothetical protein